MLHHAFGRTGLQVSAVGFGAAPVGVLEVGVEKTRLVLDLLLDHGVNLVDTSACYRGSEDLLGEVLEGRRDRVVLVSKCGHEFDGAPAGDFSPARIAASVDRSLTRLRTDHLDVMLLHSCDREVLERGDAIGALVAAREAGKVRFVGYSGDNEAAAHACRHPEIAVVETSVNVADQANIDRVLPAARENDVGLIAKRPLANCAWKDAGEQPGGYGEYAKPYAERLARMGIDPADHGFEGPPAEAWPRFALRFSLSSAGVHTAIAGTTNPGHARANLAAAQEGALPGETVDAIREAFRRAEAAAGETWPGLT